MFPKFARWYGGSEIESIVRKVLIHEDELKKIFEDRDRWASKGLETGGYIFGKIFPNYIAQVTHVIDGGPKAERTPVSFSGDHEYATRVKEDLRKENPDIRLLGEYHVHPWSSPANLSAGDVRQLWMVKQVRPWFFNMLLTKNDFRIWDLNGNKLVELPYQVLRIKMSREELLDRTWKVLRHDVLMDRSVLVVGLGSGGSRITEQIGCTGVGRIILVDSDDLEVANVIRHVGGIEDVGKPKVEICKRIVESHNPFAIVENYKFDVTEDLGKLEELVSQVDLIIGSTGSPKVNNFLNRFSVEFRVPAIYGGVYERAVGGYVLAVPKPGETACFNCLFKLTSQSYSVDGDAARRYGFDEDELHQQQGLWIDISFPALILSKMALAILEGKELGYNLVLFDCVNLDVKKLNVARRDDCVVCSKEGWIKKVEESLRKSKLEKIFEKFSRVGRFFERLRKSRQSPISDLGESEVSGDGGVEEAN